MLLFTLYISKDGLMMFLWFLGRKARPGWNSRAKIFHLTFPYVNKICMCPARKRVGLPSKPVIVAPDVGDRANSIAELHKECEKITRENEEIQAKIRQYEEDSLKMIEKYRGEIDDRTLKTNETIHQIEDLHQETADIIKKMNDDNEAKKQQVYQEDAEICSEIDACTTHLGIIKKFEEEKESIAQEIQKKEQSIEDEKRNFEDMIETAKRTTQDLFERNAKQNEETLEKEKENYYDYLLRTTDPAVLLHIQRRNSYENDLLTLKEMHSEFAVKIESRKAANEKLRRTIKELSRGDVIKRSAEQRKNINALRKDVATAKEQIKTMQSRYKQDRDKNEKEWQEESGKIDIALKHQQDQLDHKLQQISALRELTLTVLSYRSQLEAEFITVLGEMIYEVGQRENPGQTMLQSRATRRLANTAGKTAKGTRNSKAKEISINHILARFTLEDRFTVLQRFMDRVHGEVDDDDRNMSQVLEEETETYVDEE